MGSEPVLQAEDYANVYNLVHPGKTSVTNFFFLGWGHCAFDDRRVYSTLQQQDKSLDHLYLKHAVWSNVLSSTKLLSIEYIRSNF